MPPQKIAAEVATRYRAIRKRRYWVVSPRKEPYCNIKLMLGAPRGRDCHDNLKEGNAYGQTDLLHGKKGNGGIFVSNTNKPLHLGISGTTR
jgi:hypothetical protein